MLDTSGCAGMLELVGEGPELATFRGSALGSMVSASPTRSSVCQGLGDSAALGGSGIEDKMKTFSATRIMIMFNRAFSCVNMALSLEVIFFFF